VITLDEKGPLLLVPIGLPGSGNSNWARALAWQEVDVEVVSTDDISLFLFGSLEEAHAGNLNGGLAKKHQQVFEIFHQEIETALMSKKRVVADASNVKAFARERLIDVARKQGAKIHAIVFKQTNPNRTRINDPSKKSVEIMNQHFQECLENIHQEKFDRVIILEEIV